MTVITTRLTVAQDGTISAASPLPPGQHEVIVRVTDRPRKKIADLPMHPGVWDDAISLSRSDLYGDDER